MPEMNIHLLYDRDCGFCVSCVKLIRRLDRRRRVTPIAWQETGALDLFGITAEDGAAAAWALERDGTRHRGAGAVNAALSAALGTRIPLRVYSLRGIRWLQDWVYQWVADNRHRMPGGSRTCTLD
ncbi:thiol-disulfide oxidoreductase DCC family protein [Hoyosella altamirensis]|uniref:Putative DCC family thiol-disulfide oxidoreductase YuxK n=1 Tax=Hoyosella altamirensis TaxID=616997 RepID=A0A839RSK9_9ACTN|nr:DCC1-like thiol-disulfide oxidoreductase family protein [Hoyosella altamirensis]MBB3039339.1 putative DCC family thiol-disulfide oxidoreductase YuxK [Hoyosella altamirensis]